MAGGDEDASAANRVEARGGWGFGAAGTGAEAVREEAESGAVGPDATVERAATDMAAILLRAMAANTPEGNCSR